MQTKGFTTVLLLIIILVVGAVGGAYYLGKTGVIPKFPGSATTSQSPTPTVEQPPALPTVPGEDETVNWKVYNIAQFGMEFKLPPQLSSLGELQDQSQTVPSPFTGKVFCLTFPKKSSLLIHNVYAGGIACEGNIFALGAISVDYNVGRGGTFLDISGFNYKNGKYYFSNGSIPIPDTDVAKVSNANGVDVLKLKCNYAPPKDQETLPPPYCFGDESAIGGLVNTRDTTFPGFAVKMGFINGLTEKDFDLVLSTFRFTE